MDFALPELVASLRDETRRFARQTLAPHAEALDAGEAKAIAELMASAGELGLLGLLAPEEVGGAALDALAFTEVTVALAEVSPCFARRYAAHAGPATVALAATGTLTEAHVMGTELVSYSDGGLAPRPTRYLVHREFILEGWTAKECDTTGHRGAGLCSFSVDGATQVAGSPNVQSYHDLGLAAVAWGSGRAALDVATRYAMERRQFRRPIADFQAIQWKIADGETGLEAARMLIQSACVSDAKELDPVACGQARLLASQAAMEAADHAIQIHGGYGYTREYPVERHYRSARMCAASQDAHRAALYAARG